MEQGSAPESGTASLANVRTSCDLCRRMKIKCDWQGDRCKHCVERSVECTVTVAAIPKKKRMIKKADYLAALEDRIKKMEAAINVAGLSAELHEPASTVDQIGDQAELSDKMSTLLIGEEGSSQFFGASSGISLFSPRGLQWIRDKIGAHDTEQLIKIIHSGNSMEAQYGTSFWRSRPDDEQEPLPSREVADQYVEAFFENFNPIFPVFEETLFLKLYERQYSFNPPTSTAWYAALNAVFALGSIIVQDLLNKGSVTLSVGLGSMSDVYWKYFRNASSKFTDLAFKGGEITAIQAILCMALMCQVMFAEGTQPLYILTSTAVRLSHGIGLHRSLGEFKLDPLQIQERQNVLWITYIVEAGVCLRTGRPPAMSDHNIAVALPRTKPEGYDQFRYMATLALLEARVYSELYSAKAGTRSAVEQLNTIGRLDTELTQWRDTLPQGYRPESEIICPEDQLVPAIMLHFVYYNCLTAIHRVSIHHGSWTSEPSTDRSSENPGNGKLNPRVYVSSSICLEAARRVIGLLRHFDRRFPKDSIVATAIYYPLTAALVLFTNALQNPQSTEALSDLELMGKVVGFLNRSMKSSKSQEDRAMVFTELNRIATRVVRDAQMMSLNNLKRRYEETADPSSQMLPSLYSNTPSDNQFAFTEPNYDMIPPSTSYPYDEFMSFDQHHEVYTASSSALLAPALEHHPAYTWTDPALGDPLAEDFGWYIYGN